VMNHAAARAEKPKTAEQAMAEMVGHETYFAVFQGTSNGGQRCANLRP